MQLVGATHQEFLEWEKVLYFKNLPAQLNSHITQLYYKIPTLCSLVFYWLLVDAFILSDKLFLHAFDSFVGYTSIGQTWLAVRDEPIVTCCQFGQFST